MGSGPSISLVAVRLNSQPAGFATQYVIDITAPSVWLLPTSVAVDQMPFVDISTSDANKVPLSLSHKNPRYSPALVGGVAFNTRYGEIAD